MHSSLTGSGHEAGPDGIASGGRPSRLRLLSLCAQGELAVGELVDILGQSQPRVSRHLRLLCDAGLLDRFQEGAWVFYRLAHRGPGGALARHVLALIPADEPRRGQDNDRLTAIKQNRAAAAAAYFRDNAGRWAELRSLHVDEAEIEAALHQVVAGRPIADLLDIGTGTGRILEVLGPYAERRRRRRRLARDAGRGAQPSGSRRTGELRSPPGRYVSAAFDAASFDVVTIHQVLHFADDPAAAVAEAARVLRSCRMLGGDRFRATSIGGIAPRAQPPSPRFRRGRGGWLVRECRFGGGSHPALARSTADRHYLAGRAHGASADAGSALVDGRSRQWRQSVNMDVHPSPMLPVALPTAPVAVSFEFFPPKTEKMQEFAVGQRSSPGTPGPQLRFGDVRSRRLDARAHPRHGDPHRPRDPSQAGGPFDLRRRQPRRSRRRRPTLLGRRHPPHRRLARRSAGRSQGATSRTRKAMPMPPIWSKASSASPISRSVSPPIPKPIRKPRVLAPISTI